MGDVPTHLSPPPPPPLPLKSNIPILYYGLVVVGAAAIILFIYNLVVVRWCSTQHHRPSENGPSGRSTGSLEPGSSRSFGSRNINLAAASFRYKKGDKDDQNSEYDECPVCLSVFEEGEEVRQLPRCRHCFHAPCIDMWLHSHFDCPVCRTPVEPPPVLRRHTAVDPPENSRRVLLDTGSLV